MEKESINAYLKLISKYLTMNESVKRKHFLMGFCKTLEAKEHDLNVTVLSHEDYKNVSEQYLKSSYLSKPNINPIGKMTTFRYVIRDFYPFYINDVKLISKMIEAKSFIISDIDLHIDKNLHEIVEELQHMSIEHKDIVVLHEFKDILKKENISNNIINSIEFALLILIYVLQGKPRTPEYYRAGIDSVNFLLHRNIENELFDYSRRFFPIWMNQKSL